MRRTERAKYLLQGLEKAQTVAHKPHPEPNNTSRTNEKCDVSGSVQVRGEVEVKSPIEIRHQESPTEKDKDARDKKRFVVECLGIVLVFVYAALTLWLACSSQKSANAAKSAAETSKQYMHISERAYLAIKDARIDWKEKMITLTFQNVGHIPTGKLTITIGEALLASPATGLPPNIETDAIEHHWGRKKRDSVPPDVPLLLGGTSFTRFDSQLIGNGNQILIMAGVLSYPDGFPEDGDQKTPFCFQTVIQAASKEVGVNPCNPDQTLPYLEALDKRDRLQRP